MIGDREVMLARPMVLQFVNAVEVGDPDAIAVVYAQVSARFGVDGPQAVAVLCADLLSEERAKTERMRGFLAAANHEAAVNGQAYLNEKRRVTELRDILHQKTAASTAKRERKTA